MKFRLFILALAATVALRAASDVPLFNASLAMGWEHRFVLVSATGTASGWLKLGDTFENYQLKAFDAQASALDLERDGKVTRVKLMADAAVANAPAAPTPATLADAQAVLGKMHIDEMLDRTMANQKKAMKNMVDQMAARMNAPGVAKEDFVAFQQKVMDEVMNSLDVEQMKADMAKIYSETFSKEELDGLGAFYSTPLGEALTAKQPLVQEKMSAAMQPRIMAMLPKIQQMGKDFAMEQKAKRDAAAAAAPAPAPAPKP